MKTLDKLQNKYTDICQKLKSKMVTSDSRFSYFYLILGIVMINLGLESMASAQTTGTTTTGSFSLEVSAFTSIICAIVGFIEGVFGALIMVIAGIGAIVSAAFGQYRAALGLLAVAIGAFLIRSLVNTFFGSSILSKCPSKVGSAAAGT